MSADIKKILDTLGADRAETAAHLRYVHRVLAGDFPDDPIVPLDKPFIDARGVIQNLVLGSFTSSAIITSKTRSVRANHWHRTDWHFSYVVSGEIWYYERPIGVDDKLAEQNGATNAMKKWVIGPGQMFFTAPRMAHAMAFSADTSFLTFSKNVREHDTHEEDVVRVPLLDADAVWKELDRR
jgi:dTDP-4-dehydrorhamnose 3,5-epimerase-like enzyme